jgi:hypothetical protein
LVTLSIVELEESLAVMMVTSLDIALVVKKVEKMGNLTVAKTVSLLEKY